MDMDSSSYGIHLASGRSFRISALGHDGWSTITTCGKLGGRIGSYANFTCPECKVADEWLRSGADRAAVPVGSVVWEVDEHDEKRWVRMLTPLADRRSA
jgi:hypothetical protein